MDSWDTIDIDDSNMSDQVNVSSENIDHNIKIKFETLHTMDSWKTIDVDDHISDQESVNSKNVDDNSIKIKFETLHTMDSWDTIDIEDHILDQASISSKDFDNMVMMTTSGNSMPSDSGENSTRSHLGQPSSHHRHQGSKSWTQENMDAAIEALRTYSMNFSKASATFGIPSTTLWQRAQRLGIDIPKTQGPVKLWSDKSLNNALDVLRTGTVHINEISKVYDIPSSTLYKIARQEGIRLKGPINTIRTPYSPADLDRALEAIRIGQTSVHSASMEYGIPTKTLYGHCKKKGIELTKSSPTSMTEAIKAIRLGHMNMNQAAAHYNIPYSTIYHRFQRIKIEEPIVKKMAQVDSPQHTHQSSSQNH